MYECPSFFPLGTKHVLFVSTLGTTVYWVGTYKDFQFQPELEGRLDSGAYYAPITQLDDKGKRILWGWIQERRSRDAQNAAGWSGALSLPRVISLGKDGKLYFEPAPQLHSLRRTRQNILNMTIPNNRPLKLPDVEGDALEIYAEFEPGDAEEFGLHVLMSPDMAEHTPILYDRQSNKLSKNADLRLTPGEALRLHVFIDGSVIEVFANGRACLTERAYTSSPSCNQVALFSRGGTAKLRSMQVYELKPISENRMTT
jgi:beta-fructofuranosidase